MIDFAAFEEYGPGCAEVGNLKPLKLDVCNCALCLDEGRQCKEWIQHFNMNDNSEIGNDSCNAEKRKQNYLLLPPRVLGYCLNSKIWGQFQVQRITDIEPPSPEDFDNKLVFPDDSEDVKQDLKTLVVQHGSTEGHTVADPIAGKGCGLVILLHGTEKDLSMLIT
jgi:hypothetical protein